MKADLPTIIAIVIIGCLFAGSVLAYSGNPNEFSAECTVDRDTATVTMHSTIESSYEVYALTLSTERDLLIYQDERYESAMGSSSESNSIEKLQAQLKYMNISYKMIDADELKALFEDTSKASSHSVAIFSGAFPCNVYGETLNLPRTWMDAGGLIYWISEVRIGDYSAPLTSEFNGWNPLTSPFGLSYLDEKAYATQRSDLCSLLSINQNITDAYAVIGKGASNIVNLGFESEDGRYSIAFVKYGTNGGGAVINGGDWSVDCSFAKIITSAVCDWTSYTPDQGTFRGEKTFTFDTTTGINAIYVYMGTIEPRYAKLFIL